MNTKFDFDKLFRKTYAEQFKAADTYDAWCDGIAKVKPDYAEHLRKYSWGRDTFITEKNHPGNGLYRPLSCPTAHTFEDLFDGARFMRLYNSVPRTIYTIRGTETRMEQKWNAPGPAWKFGSGLRAKSAVYFETIPTKRQIKLFKDGTVVKVLAGKCETYGTYLLPKLEIQGFRSYEFIAREDGVLVLGLMEVGDIWLALLNKGASVWDMLPPADQALIVKDEVDDRAAWGCITKNADGQEVLAPGVEPGCEVVKDKW